MKKTSTRVFVSLAITLVLGALYFYVSLPAINVYSQGFWFLLLLGIACFTVIYVILSIKNAPTSTKEKKLFNFEGKKVAKISLGVVAVPILVLILGNLFSSTFFNAEAYSKVIEVPKAVFEEDMPESEIVSNIALMDSETAQKMGDRTLGKLDESSVVSQYVINHNYSQINYKKAPQKVSNLEYADFFKWMNNSASGIPGYVMVDPVNFTDAKYVKLDKPIKYADSAYFGDYLQRALRMSYPTKIFGSCSFEIDDNGNPYYIVSCMSPKVFMFGAMDVSEVIIFDPITGNSDIYDLKSVPSWVDNVFTGTLASEKYDWYGTLKNGFWNSVIGNKDCVVTTDDYGYIIIEDDVWFFTGVTSVVADESNIGFIISNARTGEYKFYSVTGAEEYSAMKAAEGQVQEKGYVASFPSLVNVSGEATYIMVLKDSGGLVKLYALVNVDSYHIVATGSTQTEAKREYVKLLKQHNILTNTTDATKPEEEQVPKVSIKVDTVRLATIDGESYVYIGSSDGYLYKQSVSEDESVMLIKEGDDLEVSYLDTEVKKIRQILEWSFKKVEENK